jgi:hypothetical protein
MADTSLSESHQVVVTTTTTEHTNGVVEDDEEKAKMRPADIDAVSLFICLFTPSYSIIVGDVIWSVGAPLCTLVLMRFSSYINNSHGKEDGDNFADDGFGGSCLFWKAFYSCCNLHFTLDSFCRFVRCCHCIKFFLTCNIQAFLWQL